MESGPGVNVYIVGSVSVVWQPVSGSCHGSIVAYFMMEGIAKTMTTEEVTIFVAPSEHDPHIKALANRTSNLPEQYGCDIIWRAQEQWWGIQRKEVKDFFASVQDGRLAVELAQMRGNLAIPLVIIEGKMIWSEDDILMHTTFGKPVTRASFHGMLFAITYEGANVFFTDSTKHTAALVTHLASWSQKDDHNSMRRRPGPDVASMWGKATNKDWARHLLQSFPGIGPTVASDIIEHFGRVPMRWDCEPADLVRIPGVGKVRAKALIEAFDEITT